MSNGELAPIHEAELVPFGAEPTADVWTRQREKGLVGAFLANFKGNTRQTYADHLGYPWRVTPTKTQPLGADRDVSALRHGLTFLRWCEDEGLHPFVDVTRTGILVWVDELATSRHPKTGKPLDTITQGQMVSAVSRFYKWACENGHATAQPVMVDRRALQLWTKTAESPTRSLDRSEVHALLEAADTDPARGSDPIRTGAMVALLFELGLRVSELIGLATADMSIMQGRRVVTVTGKGGKRRTLTLTPATAARIDRHLATRDGSGPALALPGQVSAHNTPLIAARAPTTAALVPLRRGDVLTKLRYLARLAGIEQPETISPHVARHSWATAAREEGVPGSEIKNHFGHADERTSDRYGHHVARITNSPVDLVARAYAEAAGLPIGPR